MKNHDFPEFDHRLARMKVATAIIGGIGIAGSVVSGVSSSHAADQQADAAQKAAAAQQQQYQQNRTDQQPYMQAGQGALSQIQQNQANGTGFATPFSQQSFMSTPGYNFQLQQGQNAVNSSAAATGGTLNGGTLKALQQYSTGLANQTYGDAYSRYLANSSQQYNQLFNVAQLGQNATATLGSQGTQSANNQGNYLTQQGNAQATGTIGVGNAINQGLGSGGLLALAGRQSQSGYSSQPYNPNQTNSPDMG